ncbi:MAG: hypothetical protein ILNGONEN_01784 [Syntrophorhabdaceae bacterium]|jgi:hypothetical protein|nr:hypothetical protein [Syntrophorhabdaceae bacterium]
MENLDKEEIRKDIKEYSKIESVKESEGGKMLLKKLRADIISCIEVIDSSYKDLTHIELISHCAELHEKFEMYKVFMNATPNKKMASECLEEILKNFPDDVENT